MDLREVMDFTLQLVREYPGKTADFYIPIVARMFGLRDKTVSGCLRLLHLSGDLIVRDGRFYPAPEPTELPKKPKKKVLVMVMEYE